MVARPFPVLVFFFVLGIFLAAQLDVPGWVAFVSGSFVFLLALAGIIRRWSKNHWLFCFLFFAVGFLFARQAYEEVNYAVWKYCNHWVTVQGVVARETDLRTDSVYYYLDVREIVLGEKKQPLKARLLVKAPAPSPVVYNYGDLLKIHGLLTYPAEKRNPGEFDYRAYLERRGIVAVLKVPDASRIEKKGVEGSLFLRRLLILKEKMLAVSKQTLPPEKGALVNGIVFGTQGEIPRELWQTFSSTGIVHILSVSGMHVGLLLAGLFYLFNLLRVPLRWRAPVAGTILTFYALLCGLGPAVTRASFMGLMLIFAHHFGRDQDWPTTLSLAGFFYLLLNPLAIYDIGFQLSFSATWGILYLGPVLDRLTARFLPGPRWLKSLVWVTLAAQLATLSLVAWYYNIFSVVSLPANLVAAPLTGAVLALGIASGVTGLFSPFLASLLNASTSFVLDIFIYLVHVLARLPGAFFSVPTPPLLLVIGWFPFLFLAGKILSKEKLVSLPGLFQKNKRVTPALLVVLLVAFLGAGWWAGTDQKELVLHFIDVGQGDSIFIKTPAGKNILVDAGGWNGEFESGKGAGNQVVVPYLRRLGVRKLDLFVITHPHEDHAGGAKAVAETFPVNLAVISPLGFNEPILNSNSRELLNRLDRKVQLPPAYLQLLTLLTNKNIPVYPVMAGDKINCDPSLEITVLSPPFPLLAGTRSDENNASLALLLRYKEKYILLGGDMEKEAQDFLCRSGFPFGADVLKVPHHGSRYYSLDFFETVKPKVAVITVGARNQFGLPAGETLDMLRRLGAEIFRTDDEGALILFTDGKNLQVKSFRKKRAVNF